MSNQALAPAAHFIEAHNKDLMALIPFTDNSELRKRYLWRQIIAVNQIISGSPQLRSADHNSILASFTEAVMLGLEFGALQEAHLVPFEGKAQLIIGFRGLRRLAKQNKNFVDVETRIVYERDEFDYQYGDNPFLKHKPSMTDDPGEPIFAYTIVSILEPITGKILKHFKVMPRKHWEGIKKKSKAYQAFKAGKIKSTPWGDEDFEPEMICKTCLRWTLKDFEQSPMLAQAHEIESAFENGRMPIINAEAYEKMPENAIREIPSTKAEKANEILDAKLDAGGQADIPLPPDGDDKPKKGRKSKREQIEKYADDLGSAVFKTILDGVQCDSIESIPDAALDTVIDECKRMLGK